MHGKVIVVTGARGALGKVVVETALARGARVAGIAVSDRRRRPPPGQHHEPGVQMFCIYLSVDTDVQI